MACFSFMLDLKCLSALPPPSHLLKDDVSKHNLIFLWLMTVWEKQSNGNEIQKDNVG